MFGSKVFKFKKKTESSFFFFLKGRGGKISPKHVKVQKKLKSRNSPTDVFGVNGFHTKKK